MPSHANLPTDILLVAFLEIIMSYPFYDLDSYERNKGELLSKILVYEVEHITKKGRVCVL
jgi:hypothetical protein